MPTIAVHGHELVRRLGEPLLGGNRADVIFDTEQAREGLLSSLAKAVAHVNLDASLLYPSSSRTALVNGLVRARRAGTRVQVLTRKTDLDPLSRELGLLNAAGVTLSGTLESHSWRSAIGRRGSILRRQLAVIDGRQAWVGPGLSPEAHEVDHERPGLHMQVQGPAVALLQRLFLATWQGSSPRASLPRARYFPSLTLSGDQRIGIASNTTWNEKGKPGTPLLGAASVARSSLAVTLTGAVSTPELAQALSAAASRGVLVSVLLPAGCRLTLLWRARVEEWLNAGIRVYQCHPGQLQAAVCVADGVWASVVFCESASRRSIRCDGDAELLILDPSVPARLHQLHQMQCLSAQPLERMQLSAPLGWLRRVVQL